MTKRSEVGPRTSTRANKPSHGQTRFKLSDKSYDYRYYIFNCLQFQPFAEDFMKEKESQKFRESPFERGSRVQLAEEFNKKNKLLSPAEITVIPSSNKKAKKSKTGCGCVGSEKTPPCSTGACGCRKKLSTCSLSCTCKGQCANSQKPEATPEELASMLQSLKQTPSKKTKAKKTKAKNKESDANEI